MLKLKIMLILLRKKHPHNPRKEVYSKSLEIESALGRTFGPHQSIIIVPTTVSKLDLSSNCSIRIIYSINRNNVKCFKCNWTAQNLGAATPKIKSRLIFNLCRDDFPLCEASLCFFLYKPRRLRPCFRYTTYKSYSTFS